MTNPNGCTGLNCPLQHDKIGLCDLKECQWYSRETEEDVAVNLFRSFLGQMSEGWSNENTPDLVDVVRCRDCVYSREYDVANPGYTLVCLHNGTSRQVWSNDYCSYGRRREKKEQKNPEKG